MNQGHGFIAVHVGAGYHSPSNSEIYKNICSEACLQAMVLLKDKKSAVDVIKCAVRSLEDSPWTNAGVGSNLALDGNVECDASIMDGKSLHYGAVGAVSGIKNPIALAEDLVKTQVAGNMSLGRIPPSILVGTGASKWAKCKNIEIVDATDLITESSHRSYIKHKRKLDLTDNPKRRSKQQKLKHTTTGASQSCTLRGRGDSIQDTVGAICVDFEGNVASGVSSGGILLKQPGRVGQAAIYGCGCWAENVDDSGVAVSTTGSGELLIKTLFAKECGACLQLLSDPTIALSEVFRDKFLGSAFLKQARSDQKLAGALALKSDNSDPRKLSVEAFWAHTSDSMCFALMSSDDMKPSPFISRLPQEKQAGKCYIIQSKNYSINISSS